MADRISLLEQQVEQAKAAATAARAQRAEAIAAGEAAVRRALPEFVRDVRAWQARLQAFAAEMEALDGPVGAAYFVHRSPAFLIQQLDAWTGGLGEAFPVERR